MSGKEAFKVTNSLVNIGNVLYPVTHSFINKDKVLYPVIEKFIIKKTIPDAVEALTGDFYESINTIWFDTDDNYDVLPPVSGENHSFSIDFTFACVGLYDTGQPPNAQWPYGVNADAFSLAMVYQGKQSDEAYYWNNPNNTGWRYIVPWRFVEGVMITKSEAPQYKGASYGFDPEVNILTVAPERQLYHLNISGSWLQGYINPQPGSVNDKPPTPYVPEAPFNELVGTNKMPQWGVDYPILSFWSNSGHGMYTRPTNGQYPPGMIDVLWWVYDFKQVFDGYVVQKIRHPLATSTNDLPFELNQGIRTRKIIANKWKYAPWERYPTLI